MNERIVIEVANDGTTKVSTQGYAGDRCQQASEFIERALGSTASEQFTVEFFQTNQTSEEDRVSEGETK